MGVKHNLAEEREETQSVFTEGLCGRETMKQSADLLTLSNKMFNL